jgi:hypothetical protein
MTRSRRERSLSTDVDQEAIDRTVVAQAEDDSAWEKPVVVRPSRKAHVELPAELAARAAFFARLHRAPSLQAWLHRVVQERTELEEAAYASLKRDLAGRLAG